MRGVLRIERDRGRRAELIQQRPPVLRVDRGRCFVFEDIPEGTIYTTARPAQNSKTWLFSFLSRVMVRLRAVCNRCTVRTLLFVLSGVFLYRRT